MLYICDIEGQFWDIESIETSMLMIQKRGLCTHLEAIHTLTMRNSKHGIWAYDKMSVWTQFRPLVQWNGNLIASLWNGCRKYVCTMQSLTRNTFNANIFYALRIIYFIKWWTWRSGCFLMCTENEPSHATHYVLSSFLPGTKRRSIFN